jgi:hypothetical protein
MLKVPLVPVPACFDNVQHSHREGDGNSHLESSAAAAGLQLVVGCTGLGNHVLPNLRNLCQGL